LLSFVILKIKTQQQIILDKQVCKFSSEISSFDRFLENDTGNILGIYLATLVGE
jgi:hypothetical protein